MWVKIDDYQCKFLLLSFEEVILKDSLIQQIRYKIIRESFIIYSVKLNILTQFK